MNLTEKLFAEFEVELVKSEYQRSLMLAAIFAIAAMVMLFNYLLLEDSVLKFYGGDAIYFFTLGWVFVFILYELGVLWFIKRYREVGKKISTWFKVFQTTIEITFMSLLILYIVDIKNVYLFIDSPIQFVYFFFIILSILHLDYRVSLFTGALAATQFAFVIYYAFHLAGIPVRYMPSLPENAYYIRCIIFMLSSGVAAFVSREVMRRVRLSLDSKLQKSEIEAHFGQQVSKEILATLTQEGGKSKKTEATVMALDIRGFTKFAEGKSLEEIQDFQNSFFGPVLDIINQHRGVVNQILGDGVMATFGALSANPLHADMAFQASLEILKKIKELSRDGVIPETRLGIGIHSGEVMTGNIGSEHRKQYSISGTAVIIAFRVEQLNKDYESEFLITKEVKDQIVQGQVVLEELGLVSLKGLENKVLLYKVNY
ncbi:MAG: adenylate/guanylate cyclase domain-containing protein [Cyclobacteriaceae bacterium]